MAQIIFAKHIEGQLRDEEFVEEVGYAELRHLVGYEYLTYKGDVYHRAEVGTVSATYLSVHPGEFVRLGDNQPDMF